MSKSRKSAGSEELNLTYTQKNVNLKDEFWKTSLTFTNSTFGTAPRSAEPSPVTHRYSIAKDAQTWATIDQFGSKKGRPRIVSTLGRDTEVPSPAHYTPKIDFLTKRELTPSIGITHRKPDYYFDEVQENLEMQKKFPGYERKQKKKKKPQKIQISEFANVNVEDMKKALLPGPGSYEVSDENFLAKFERPPEVFLAPRKRIAERRPVMDFENLEVLDGKRENKITGGNYNLTKDPRKIEKTFRIGVRRPLLGKTEILPTGPGYYNTEKYFCFEQNSMLSSKETLKMKPLDYIPTKKVLLVSSKKST